MQKIRMQNAISFCSVNCLQNYDDTKLQNILYDIIDLKPCYAWKDLLPMVKSHRIIGMNGVLTKCAILDALNSYFKSCMKQVFMSEMRDAYGEYIDGCILVTNSFACVCKTWNTHFTWEKKTVWTFMKNEHLNDISVHLGYHARAFDTMQNLGLVLFMARHNDSGVDTRFNQTYTFPVSQSINLKFESGIPMKRFRIESSSKNTTPVFPFAILSIPEKYHKYPTNFNIRCQLCKMNTEGDIVRIEASGMFTESDTLNDCILTLLYLPYIVSNRWTKFSFKVLEICVMNISNEHIPWFKNHHNASCIKITDVF
jgi:hypothetical protein